MSTQVDAVADTEIWAAPIMNSLKNTATDVSIYTIQVTPQADGILILVDAAGDEIYLAGDDTYGSWMAKVPILVTYMMSKDDSFNLKYSETATLSNVIILENGSIY